MGRERTSESRRNASGGEDGECNGVDNAVVGWQLTNQSSH